MTKKKPVFAPKEVFDQTLEYFVIPTFDLVIDIPEKGVLIVRRKIAPYAGKWALPGLRMYKNESVDETLMRIARQEVGVDIAVNEKILLGQFVGKFKTEHDRQDLSSGYAVTALSNEPVLNDAHFTGKRFINDVSEIPADSGAMYRYYLETYFSNKGVE